MCGLIFTLNIGCSLNVSVTSLSDTLSSTPSIETSNPGIHISAQTVNESIPLVNVTVSLSQSSQQTISVEYSTQDGTAIAGLDYALTTGTLSFAPGEISKTITITILPDTDVEADEIFTVQLSNPLNASLIDTAGTVTILNDDIVTTKIIYRSVGFNATTALAVGTSNGMTISAGIATFASSLPNNVGVGDALQYNSDTSLVFIHERIDSTHYKVRTASAQSPANVTASDTSWSIYRAYTSLTNAVDKGQAGTENTGIAAGIRNFDNWTVGRDLVANDEQWNVVLYADASHTTRTQISGWNTDDTHYLNIFVPYLPTHVGASQRHQGYWDDTKFNVVFGGAGRPFDIGNIKNVVLDGLQIRSENNSIDLGYDANDFPTSGSKIIIKNNIISGVPGTGYSNSGINADPSLSSVTSGSIFIVNNIIFNRLPYGTATTVGSMNYTTYVFNNTAALNENGFIGTAIYKNNIAVMNTGSAYNATFLAGSTNNLSSNADSSGLNPIINQTVYFENPGAGDFRLSSYSAASVDRGVNLSSDPAFAFSIDSGGTARGTLWDLGASESQAKPIYRSIGPANTDRKISGGGNDLTISNGIATFSVVLDLETSFGVGDAIEYDSDNNNSVDSVIFIQAVIDSTHLVVRTSSGAIPADMAVADQNWAVYRAYTSLANAMTGVENTGLDDAIENFDNWTNRDLVTNNEQWNLALYADGADTGFFNTNTWTTSSTQYMRIFAPTHSAESLLNQRHEGVWHPAKSRISANNYFSALYFYGNYTSGMNVIIEGLLIENAHDTGGGGTGHGIWLYDQVNSKAIIRNNIVRGAHATRGDTAINVSGNGLQTYVYNNIVSHYEYGITVACAGGTTHDTKYIANNTAADIGTAGFTTVNYSSNETVVIKNNLFQALGAGGAGFVIGSGVSDPVYSHNLSSDTTALGTSSIQSATVTFLDQANRDFRLSPEESGAKNSGTDLSTFSTYSVTTDNSLRLRTLWDIGANEAATSLYRSVGPGNTSILACGTTGGGCTGQGGLLIDNGTSQATFAAGLANTIGVGDAIVYDCNSSGTLGASDCVAFIHGRTSSTVYTVKNATGDSPTLTSTTVWRIYRAYTSLTATTSLSENSAIGAIDATLGNFDDFWLVVNLARNNTQMNFSLYADAADTSTPEYPSNDWTTSAQNYIRIFAPSLSTEVGTSQRHSGIWDNTKARVVNDGYDGVIAFGVQGMRIDGLQLENNRTQTGSERAAGISSNSWLYGDIQITNNIIRKTVAVWNGWLTVPGIITSGTHSRWVISNNIVAGFNVGILLFGGEHRYSYVYNNTVVNSNEDGFYIGSWALSSHVSIKNNISTNNGTADYYFSGTAIIDEQIANLSEDATSPNASFRNKTVTFVNPGSYNYLLSTTDTEAKNNGATLTFDSQFRLSTDITGATRTLWCIGASNAY